MTTDPSITDPCSFWLSQRTIYPQLSAMALGIHSIPAMSAGVGRLFSQCKLVLSDRRNRVQIDGHEAVECLKWWDKLEVPQVVVTEAGYDGPELDADEQMEMFVV
jgi:hypothetical protein